MAELTQNSHFVRRELLIPTGAKRIPITQSLVALLGAGLFAFFDATAAYSALLGGLACVVPSAYAVWRVFGAGRSSGHSGMREFGLMIRAEVAKFALTGAIFALIFWQIPNVDPIAMFTVFAVAMLAGWVEAGLRMNSQ